MPKTALRDFASNAAVEKQSKAELFRFACLRGTETCIRVADDPIVIETMRIQPRAFRRGELLLAFTLPGKRSWD